MRMHLQVYVKVLVKKNPCRPTHNSNNAREFQKIWD